MSTPPGTPKSESSIAKFQSRTSKNVPVDKDQRSSQLSFPTSLRSQPEETPKVTTPVPELRRLSENVPVDKDQRSSQLSFPTSLRSLQEETLKGTTPVPELRRLSKNVPVDMDQRASQLSSPMAVRSHLEGISKRTTPVPESRHLSKNVPVDMDQQSSQLSFPMAVRSHVEEISKRTTPVPESRHLSKNVTVDKDHQPSQLSFPVAVRCQPEQTPKVTTPVPEFPPLQKSFPLTTLRTYCNLGNLVAWMPRPKTAVCHPGLEHLTAVDEVLIHDSIEYTDEFANSEMKKGYRVKNNMFQQIYRCIIDPGSPIPGCCSKQTAFVINVMDKEDGQVMTVSRSCQQSCPCSGLRDQVEVQAGGDEKRCLGYVKSVGSSSNHSVLNGSGATVLQLKQNSSTDGRSVTVLAGDGMQVGSITEKRVNLEEQCPETPLNVVVKFPLGMNVELKADLLSAVFLLDCTYFRK